jgi:tetratricopeptide (TPR) repeat protein
MNANDRHLDRASLLLSQRRYADAERELHAALLHTPNDGRLHAILALTLRHMDRLEDATREAEQAIGLAPDLPLAHYAHGEVMSARNRHEQAEASARQAVALDPMSADHWCLLAAIQFDLRRWQNALDAAESGLEVEPDHDGCSNIRAMALVQLGRKDEAARSIEGMLARDPENAVSHANQGWTCLHQGNPDKALEHFREALRLDPTQDWARAGMVEALKARHLIYRLILRYFLWMSRLGRGAQWGLVIGGFVGQRLLVSLSRSNPALRPFVLPIIVAYLLFVLLSWLADPMFNLMLRLNRFGRYALDRRQIWASNVLAALLLSAVTLTTIAILSDRAVNWLIAAGVLVALTLPATACFRMPQGWPTLVMTAGTATLALVGLGAVAFSVAADSATNLDEATRHSRTFSTLIQFFFYGLLASQFGANYLATVRPQR